MGSQWALGSITTNKASGGDGISAELFQILKDDAVKVLYSISSKFGKLSSGHNWKRSICIPIPKKSNANVQTTTQLYSYYTLVK